jgi:hypothetical protein
MQNDLFSDAYEMRVDKLDEISKTIDDNCEQRVLIDDRCRLRLEVGLF